MLASIHVSQLQPLNSRMNITRSRLLLCVTIATITFGSLPAQAKRAKAKKATAQLHAVHKKGKFLYKKVKKPIALSIGKQLEAKTKIKRIEFFDKPAISCQLDIVNKSKTKLYISYHVAFFDKDGNLIGCASQSMGFDPGERTTVGGALVHAPESAMVKITSYQLRYWESTEKL